MRLTAIITTLLCACASSNSETDPDAGAAADAAAGAPADAPATTVDAANGTPCPDGQLATDVAANDELTCATIDDAPAVAVRSRCSIYLGHRDSCDGCTDPPATWSANGPLTCSPGVGAGDTCLEATLDDPETPVELATLGLDGDVDGNDKLFTTLHCITASRSPRPAPCEPGWAITGKSGSTWMCAPISEAAVSHVRSRCAVYLGWQDGCDGCTSPPTKWGFANDAGCTNGAGADNTCVTATLDGETVNLFGLNTDGDVDGNDKLHLGLHCDATTDDGGTSMTACPDGQFVVGINADDSVQCADPAATFAAYVGEHCSLFLGSRDNCDGCTRAPAKWGLAGTATCANGAGADNTCTDMTLGDATLPMFGLNTDGDVDDNDTLYVGFRCNAP